MNHIVLNFLSTVAKHTPACFAMSSRVDFHLAFVLSVRRLVSEMLQVPQRHLMVPFLVVPFFFIFRLQRKHVGRFLSI